MLSVGRELALGLAAAHDKGLIHRDVKPANIWLEGNLGAGEPGASATGGGSKTPVANAPNAPSGPDRVKILDFGLARVADDVHLTRVGMIVGTPAYMSPEQSRSEPLDFRSDLFSLGCVLYRLCTGFLPFQGDSPLALLRALALDRPRPLGEVRPDLPPALADLVMRLLAGSPKDRPASAKAVAETLDALARGQTAPLRPSRRRTIGAVAAGLLVAVVLTLGAMFTLRTNNGTLVLTVSEPDVQVFVDGEQKITIESKKVGKVVLLPGKHALEVKRGDKVLHTETFTIEKGGETLLDARWTPQGSGERVGARPLDALDPGKIPAAERIPGQPPELVAVLGSHREGSPRAGHSGRVVALAFSQDGKTLASSGKDGTVRLWRPDGGKFEQQVVLSGLSTPVGALALSPDGTRLACGSGAPNPSFRLLDVSGPKPLEWTVPAGVSAGCIDFSPDGGTLVCGDSTGVNVWRLPPSGEARLLEAQWRIKPGSGINSVAFSPDGKKLVVGANTGLYVWDLSGPPKSLGAWTYPTPVLAVAVSPDGRALARRHGTAIQLKPMPPAKRKDLPLFAPPLEGAVGLGFAADGRSVYVGGSASGAGFVRQWFSVSDMKLCRWPLEFAALAVAADGRHLALGNVNGTIYVARMPSANTGYPPLEEDWVKKVTALPPEEQMKAVRGKLEERNPGFTGPYSHRIEKDRVVSFELGSSPSLFDLSPLRVWKLRTLKIEASVVANLAPLRDMPLEELVVHSPVLFDLSGLRGTSLIRLDVSGTRVTNLSALTGLPLKEIRIDYSPAQDAELRSLTTLEKINGKALEEFWKEPAAEPKKP
jgi:WD40 repeat protein